MIIRRSALAAIGAVALAAGLAVAAPAGTASAVSQVTTKSNPGIPAGNLEKEPDNFLYVWAGAEGRQKPDRLVTLGFDPASDTYGRVLHQTLIPGTNATGNEPHHCGISKDSKMLICGGLLSATKGQDWLFVFDLSDPAQPRLAKTMKSSLASYPDDFIALPGGGFLLTEMGSMTGTSPGRLAVIDANGNITGEYPQNPPGEYNPHGIAARLDLALAVTCDYIDPYSTLNTTPGPALVRSSVEVFDLNSMEIVHRMKLPEGTATMDCKMMHHTKQGLGYVGGSGDGKLYLFNASTGTVQLAFDAATVVPGAATQYMQISMNDQRLYVPYFSNWTTTPAGRTVKSAKDSGILVLDISDPAHPKPMQNFKLPAYAGPHMSMLMDNDRKFIVTDYLLDQDDLGKIHFNGDHYTRAFDVTRAGYLVADQRFQVDFNTLIPGVKLRPHGANVFDMGMMDMDKDVTMPDLGGGTSQPAPPASVTASVTNNSGSWVHSGTTFFSHVTIKNPGTTAKTGITVRGYAPPGTQFTTLNGTAGWAVNGRTATYAGLSAPPGSQVTLMIASKLSFDVARGQAFPVPFTIDGTDPATCTTASPSCYYDPAPVRSLD